MKNKKKILIENEKKLSKYKIKEDASNYNKNKKTKSRNISLKDEDKCNDNTNDIQNYIKDVIHGLNFELNDDDYFKNNTLIFKKNTHFKLYAYNNETIFDL